MYICVYIHIIYIYRLSRYRQIFHTERLLSYNVYIYIGV